MAHIALIFANIRPFLALKLPQKGRNQATTFDDIQLANSTNPGIMASMSKQMETSKPQGINLSAIGGVDTSTILDLAKGYIGVLTSVRKPAALLLPWPWSERIANIAAENCRTMTNVQTYTGLRTEVITSLTDGEFRTVWMRAAEPVAVLSRYPQDEIERESIAQRYLALLDEERKD